MLNSNRLLSSGLALGLFAACTATHAAPPQVAGFSYVKSLDGIDEYRLDSNGLSVLLKSDHSAPVVTFQVTYRVGSAMRLRAPPARRISSNT